MRHLPRKLHQPAQAQTPGKPAQPQALRSLAHDLETEIQPLGAQLGTGPQQEVIALALADGAHGQDLQGLGLLGAGRQGNVRVVLGRGQGQGIAQQNQLLGGQFGSISRRVRRWPGCRNAQRPPAPP